MSPHRDLLIKARELIDRGRERFICIALERVWHTPAESEGVSDLTEIIHEGLLPVTSACAGLEDWAWAAHFHDITDQHAQLARLAWIDKLLERYPT